MSSETRWRIIEDGKPNDADAQLTATKEVAEYIVESIIAANEEQGDTTNVRAVRADLAEGPRADLVSNVRFAGAELGSAVMKLEDAIDNVSNIDVAAQAVASLSAVLTRAAEALHQHDELLEPQDRGY